MSEDPYVRAIVALHNLAVAVGHARDLDACAYGCAWDKVPMKLIAEDLQRVADAICPRVQRAMREMERKDGTS